jgi:phenylalanyl-tRNA synthetase beta chain
MRFTYSWLSQYLETTANPETIAHHLTDLGLEVESVTDLGTTLKEFKVVEIIEATQHPDADRLKVCQANTGSETVQVVCGGPNARTGLKTILALPGMIIPSSGIALKAGKLRGVDSCGMLCSEQELGLPQEVPGTIIEIPSHIPVGTPVVDALGLNDPLFEISITPNRGDCLGIIHIARDLAARGLGSFKAPVTKPISGTCNSPITIGQNATNHYMGCYIKDVSFGKFPKTNQLASIGVNSISPIVDITNYISVDFGHPLHAFDADLITGQIHIRFANDGEEFLGLNDLDYTLTSSDLVIADDEKVLALAGILGGRTSAVQDTTKNIFLESAWFDPIQVALSGRRHGILTDSRSRFERGVDPLSSRPALEKAVQLIMDSCGGCPSNPVESGTPKDISKEITLPYSLLKTLGGVSLMDSEVHKILKDLGFTYLASKSTAEFGVFLSPSWRSDITIPQDLVEEVLRIHGYDKVESCTLPLLPSIPTSDLSLKFQRISNFKRLLASRGLQETITWSFVNEQTATEFSDGTLLPLRNPISQELSHMRPSLIPNLLDGAAKNHNRAISGVHLFEQGTQFIFQQTSVIGILRSGIKSQKSWKRQKFECKKCENAST